MKKLLLLIIPIFMLVGCGETDELNNIKKPEPEEKINYTYPESNVVITTELYDQIENGMSEEQVWQLLGDKCSLHGEAGDKGTEGYIVGYGCNAAGNDGATVQLAFQGNKLVSKVQFGLE